MSEYKVQLEHFLEVQRKKQPDWNQHIPDELCSHIRNAEDFIDFVKFANIAKHEGNELLEFGCEETENFIAVSYTHLTLPTTPYV